MHLFKDRYDAGKQLSRALFKYENAQATVVFGLPRGGIPVAYEVARALNLPLDVFFVRKLGVPGHEELAMGAIASGDIIFFNHEIIEELKISPSEIEVEIARQKEIMEQRRQIYAGNRNPLNCTDKAVLLIDDGIATGATVISAAKAVRGLKAKKIIIAVPLASKDTLSKLKQYVDEIVCLSTPVHFYAIGKWYDDFSQTTDAEVTKLLKLAFQSEH